MKMSEEKNETGPAHVPGTRKGEEMSKHEGKEEGRHDAESTHKDRPSGTSTASDFTGINAKDENPIDPKSPNLPAP